MAKTNAECLGFFVGKDKDEYPEQSSENPTTKSMGKLECIVILEPKSRVCGNDNRHDCNENQIRNDQNTTIVDLNRGFLHVISSNNRGKCDIPAKSRESISLLVVEMNRINAQKEKKLTQHHCEHLRNVILPKC